MAAARSRIVVSCRLTQADIADLRVSRRSYADRTACTISAGSCDVKAVPWVKRLVSAVVRDRTHGLPRGHRLVGTADQAVLPGREVEHDVCVQEIGLVGASLDKAQQPHVRQGVRREAGSGVGARREDGEAVAGERSRGFEHRGVRLVNLVRANEQHRLPDAGHAGGSGGRLPDLRQRVRANERPASEPPHAVGVPRGGDDDEVGPPVREVEEALDKRTPRNRHDPPVVSVRDEPEPEHGAARERHVREDQ